jgi:hypothetical protein
LPNNPFSLPSPPSLGGVVRVVARGVQKNRLTEKTEKTEEKLTEKTEPR